RRQSRWTSSGRPTSREDARPCDTTSTKVKESRSPLREVPMIVTNYPPEDLKKLPLRAIVALAVRCAQRVEHMALLPDDHPENDRYRAAVGAALRVAEDFARGRPCPFLESVVREIEACRAIGEGAFVHDMAMAPVIPAA